MGCFDGLIGIDGCGNDTPTSGKHLKDGGISTNELNLIAGQDYADGAEFGNAKINFATQLISQDIYNHFANKYRSVSLLDNGVCGRFDENMIVKTGASEYRGIETRLYNESSYLRLYVKTIKFFTDFDGDIDILVYDLKQNKLLDTITITSVANEISSVTVNKYYYSEKSNLDIAFVYDSTGINSYQTSVGGSGCTNCNKNKFFNCDPYLQGKGVYKTGTDFINSNMQGLGHTAGVSLEYSVECDHEKWICANANMLAIPIIYKASSEILNYAMFQTERTNYETMDVAQIKERRDFYELQYREYMDKLLSNIDVPNDNTCFLCKQKVRTRQLMP